MTVFDAARSAVFAIESHRSTVNFLGTLFRGASLGSILLVVALVVFARVEGNFAEEL